MASRKDALITGIPYVICQQANMLFIFVVGKILPRRVDLIHALEVERNKAINATVAKSQFLATMSHEIRTPISSIMGFLELLSGSGLSKEQRVEAISLAYATGQSSSA